MALVSASRSSGNDKRLPMLALMVVAIAVAVGSVLAFTTRMLPTDNVITFGSVKMHISETTLNPAGHEVAVPSNATDWMQDGPVSRIVRFENVGSESMLVRARLSMEGATAAGSAVDVNDNVHYDIEAADWICRDGWYYYERPVESGQTTSALMNAFEVRGGAGDLVGQKGRYTLTIDAQAVQSAHNAEQALDAYGWSEGVPS